jgi:hypothetical protein
MKERSPCYHKARGLGFAEGAGDCEGVDGLGVPSGAGGTLGAGAGVPSGVEGTLGSGVGSGVGEASGAGVGSSAGGASGDGVGSGTVGLGAGVGGGACCAQADETEIVVRLAIDNAVAKKQSFSPLNN